MKRFWKEARPAEVPGGWQVMLDARPVKTQAGAPQVVPGQALAAALAAEWAAQGDEIDAHSLPLRDLADLAIDVIRPARAEAIAKLLSYGETDTLCYRADPDEPLYKRQHAVWEPLLQAAEERHAVRFTRVSGIMHRPQDEAALARLRQGLESCDDFTLAALTTMTALAASLVIGLAALEPHADGAALWQAAELEEDWQAEQWGRDEEAEARRARRAAAFAAAQRFAQLVRA